MAQREILEWLWRLRATGDNEFYSCKDIQKKLNEVYNNPNNRISTQITCLYDWGFLEINQLNRRERQFRLKKKFIKKFKYMKGINK